MLGLGSAGSVAGGFDGFEVDRRFLDGLMYYFSSGDEDDREDDDYRAGEHEGVHLFAVEDAAEDDGDDGVDVTVGGDLGDGDVLEQPDVGGEADQ